MNAATAAVLAYSRLCHGSQTVPSGHWIPLANRLGNRHRVPQMTVFLSDPTYSGGDATVGRLVAPPAQNEHARTKGAVRDLCRLIEMFEY